MLKIGIEKGNMPDAEQGAASEACGNVSRTRSISVSLLRDLLGQVRSG